MSNSASFNLRHLELRDIGHVFDRCSLAQASQEARESLAVMHQARGPRRLVRNETASHETKRLIADKSVDHRKPRDQGFDQTSSNPVRKGRARATPRELIGQGRMFARLQAPRAMVDIYECDHLLPPSPNQRAERRPRLAWTASVASSRATSPTKIGNGGTSLSHSVPVCL